MSREPLSLRAGQALGRYELLAPIAKGGMGQVWAGRLRGARGFHKLVAIKTVLASCGDDERLDQMLFEEARIASLIQHSNVVQTMELGEHQGGLYLVMEWVDGEPLSQLVRSCEQIGGMPLLVAVNLIGQTLRGLQAAHDLCDAGGTPLGVVHRDVSPHNVLVSYSGVAKLVDFGIAKAMNQHLSSTSTGEIKGKFAYMAPEQILGAAVDRRADLFAAGIVLYLLTTGRHPFKNHDSAGVLHSISSSERATRPSLVQAGYSRALESVVLKALEKDPTQRWRSADEMRLALQHALPEAFGVGFEAHLAKFMTEAVGARASEKREALRRAERASEVRFRDGGSLAAVGSPAHSAGSLRAVAVATSLSQAGLQATSFAPVLRPDEAVAASTQRKKKPPTLLAVCVACAVVASIAVLRSPFITQRSVSASPVVMAELPRTRRDRAPAPSASQTPPPVPLVPAALPAIAVSAHAEAQIRRKGGNKNNKLHAASTGASAPLSDLIAPDYAR